MVAGETTSDVLHEMVVRDTCLGAVVDPVWPGVEGTVLLLKLWDRRSTWPLTGIPSLTVLY